MYTYLFIVLPFLRWKTYPHLPLSHHAQWRTNIAYWTPIHRKIITGFIRPKYLRVCRWMSLQWKEETWSLNFLKWFPLKQALRTSLLRLHGELCFYFNRTSHIVWDLLTCFYYLLGCHSIGLSSQEASVNESSISSLTNMREWWPHEVLTTPCSILFLLIRSSWNEVQEKRYFCTWAEKKMMK